MATETDKRKLVKSLKAQRVMLEVTLEQLSEAEMLLPGVDGEQTVKDIIAHLTVWDRRGTEWIRAAARGEMPQMPEPGKTWDDLDHLNEETYRANRDRPLKAILAEFAVAYPPLLGAVEAFPEGELARQITRYKGGQPEVMTARRLIAWRYRHYRDHGQQIREWHENLKKQSR